MKKLYKSKENTVWAGVIGGAGEYFNVDPVLLRLAWVVITLLTGFFPLFFAYILAILIVPEKPEHISGRVRHSK